MQKKAKTLGFKIPNKDQVLDQIANQHSEMKSTFLRMKTEQEVKVTPKSAKASSKGSESAKNKKDSNLMNYKSNAPKAKVPVKEVDFKSDHEK